VISKYTNLQKKGQDYIGLCLFHQDSHPSMSVSPTKKIFKCFSCGVGGNVFEFLMKYKHLSFPEAVVELAQEFNVNLDGISFAPKQDKYSAEEKRLFEVNTEASKYYQVNLSAAIGAKAKEYLLKRNITNEQIQY
jgi:DNA primase